MTTEDDIEAEDRADAELMRANFLNGDEKFNKFVRTTATMLESSARRQNKARRETRGEFASLRADLAPLIEVAHAVAAIRRWTPIVGGIVSAIVAAGGVALALGVWP